MSRQNKKASRRRKRILLSAYLLLILMTLLTVASYTWFSLSKTPRVSNLNMYVNSATGLELSQDPLAEEWTLQLDFRELVDVTTVLRPVTWVDEEQRFYAAAYGIDGRLMDYEYWQPLSDQINANKDSAYGYYIKTTFYARTDTAMTVSLSPAVEVDEGINGSGTYLIGTPLWDSTALRHNNGGQGAENAIRIGIRVTDVDAAGTSTGEEKFYIYEPNCDTHCDGTQGYIATPSITGSENLVSQDRLILQSASTWSESYPVQRDVVIRDLGEFSTSAELFKLEAGEMVKIELYVWLEGQDVDCISQIKEAQISASIQFSGQEGSHIGLQPIG